MNKTWTKGLDEDAVKLLKGDFISSQTVRKRLTEICKKKTDSAESGARMKDGYDCPNWAYKQADAVGYKRALYEIVNLLKEI